MKLSQAYEAAELNVKALKSSATDTGVSDSVGKVSVNKPSTCPCHRCGKGNHTPEECRFKTAKCHNCGRTGHISPVCRSSTRSRRGDNSKKPSKRRTKYVAVDDSSSDEVSIKQIYALGSKKTQPFHVDVLVNNQPLKMELDTGAAVSIIAESQLKRILPRIKLKPSKIKLETYTGEKMPVVGEVPVEVQYAEQTELLSFVVVAQEGPPLLGRDWLKCLRLDWKTVGAVHFVEKKLDSDLKELLSVHKAVFKSEPGTIHPYRARLQVREGATPKFCKARPVPYAIKESLDQELDLLESSGIIQSVSHSDWAAPIVAVPKKDGRIRICGDYKLTVNPALDVDQYPLPKTQDLFSSLFGGQKFSKLDFSQAYLQLMLEEDSRHYLTINTHRGWYQFTRLPFGVASAPAIFQKTMDLLLQKLPGVVCYIDDILVTGVNDEDHLKNLNLVLERLTAHGVVLKQEKCFFLQSSVDFLGHTVDAEGLHPTAEKLKAVLEAPAPQNVQELRSFLGLINYYGHFISNLSTLLSPLNRLLQSNKRWDWSPECVQAFQAAKEQLTSSAYGLGAVLSHVMPDGQEKPIAFASRTLTPSERNYSQVEKEALSLIFAVKKFHSYIYGRKFTLLTDHKPLLTILGPKNAVPALAAARMQRWALLLSAYSYDIEYKQSADHCNADGLSCLPLHQTDRTSSVPAIYNMAQIQALPVTYKNIKKCSQKDPVLSKVIRYLKSGWPAKMSDELKPYHSKRFELTMEGGVLLWGTRVVIPKKLQSTILDEIHQDHPGVVRMKTMARSYFWWPRLDKEIEKKVKGCVDCQSVNGNPPRALLHPWVWPSKPWQRFHLDFAGPFFGKMFFISVDAHSKWPEVIEMKKTTAEKTITILRKLFSSYGLPEQIVTDNGPQFTSDEFATFLKENGIKHIRSSPYHPSSNGAAERFVRTFKEAMKAGRNDARSFKHRLASFLLTYRTSIHATTNEAPCSLFMGRKLRTRLDLLRPDLNQTVTNNQAGQKRQHDQNIHPRSFAVDDAVLIKNPKQKIPWLPGVIVKQLGPLTYLIKLDDGRLWKRHVDHLKLLPSQPPVTVTNDHISRLNM